MKSSVKYYIGILKEKSCNYCLMMDQGNDSKFVILTKQMRLEDEIEFDNEVTNLIKYFNADVIIEDSVDRYKFPKKSLETYSSPIAKDVSKIEMLDLNVRRINEEAIKLWAFNEKPIEIK